MSAVTSPDRLRIEVGDGLHTAVDLHRPAQDVDRPVVAFAFPGGGYSRGYFDIRHEGGAYSQAAFHTRRGWIVAACDHLGVGDSDQPGPATLTIEALAEANDATVRAVLAKLDVEPRLVLGIGQSMGGCLTIVTQGRHRTFDAIAVLGYSAIHTVMPSPQGGIEVSAIERGSTVAADRDRTTAEIGGVDVFRWAFHSDDADEALVAADLAGGYPVRSNPPPPWGSVAMPPCAASMLTAGVVAKEAAAIDVPVFVGCGERDVVPDPRAEPTAYSSSPDISVLVVPGMAHMHNFARTREVLWRRLHAWAEAIA
jgi:pimeloyl-ACP methyl ester carboxylesterase